MDFTKIFSNFRKRKVLVIGDLVLDQYIWGNVNRISPEAPVPVVDVTSENFLLGGACNVANNISSLGGHVAVVGLVGKDMAGEMMKQLLQEKRVACYLFDDKRPTTIKARVVAHNQQVVRFDREEKSKISGNTLKAIIDCLRRMVPEYDAVIISDYKKGVVTPELIQEVMKAAKPRNRFVAVDPKMGHFHLYKNVSLITPNIMEASNGAGIEIKDEESLIKAGRILLKKLSCKAVLLTRGEDGMSLFEKGKVAHIPTVARQVYDVTGAGDTVIAAFALAHASGATLQQAAVIANHAAGIVVGEIGTAVTTTAKIIRSLKNSK
ncbi:MAG: D-glycero-beta-D-manno-heptose-7-phosphate kinase [Nitrospiraceae bacterium]|nr:D-glycero-beta-D-manno-heptose-7-phosphate kinase [Nitrospiraceae bacterium]